MTSYEPSSLAFADKLEAELNQRQKSRQEISKTDWQSDFWKFAPYVKTRDEDTPDGFPRIRPFPLDFTYLHNLDKWVSDLRGPGLIKKPVRHVVTNYLLARQLWDMMRIVGSEYIWTGGFITINEDPLGRLLARRLRSMWEELPTGLKMRLEVDTLSEIKIQDGGTCRIYHAKGDGPRQEGHGRLVLDEFAFQQNAGRNWVASVTRATQTIGCSSSNGPGTYFQVLEEQGKTPVFHIRWYDHPDHDEKWLAEQRAMLDDQNFKREILCEDVYAAQGLLSADFNEECVVERVPNSVQNNWDGKSPIAISIDPGKVDGAGAMIRYFNKNLQDVRLASFFRQGLDTDELTLEVCEYAKARWPNADWLLTGDPAALQERDMKTRFNEHTNERIIVRVASQVLAGCEYDDEGQCVKGTPLPFQIHRIPRGQGSRKERHQLQRMGFRKRSDGSTGTLIVRSENVEFLKGVRGAYKLPENPTPDMKQYEKPDRSMPCVHVMDADGYGLCQFVKFAGVPTLVETKPHREMRMPEPIYDPETGYIRGYV